MNGLVIVIICIVVVLLLGTFIWSIWDNYRQKQTPDNEDFSSNYLRHEENPYSFV